jgi:hypothetical protein
MRRSRKQYIVVLAGLLLTGGLVLAGLWLRSRSDVGRIRTDGITSYYVYSGTDAHYDGKLPAIIFIGHPLSSPLKKGSAYNPSTYKGRFDEPVLVIWSGLMSDLKKDSHPEDEIVWARKRQQFSTLLGDYQRKLPIDANRIYLTGFSGAGVCAWMLAYDHPELYAAVVPMSATSHPRQIQENLEAAKRVVTVVVRGDKDDSPPRDLAGETRTGRIIESYHPSSRFILKEGEDHHDVRKYWRENLQYVLQFRRNEGLPKDGQPSQQSERSQ